MPKCRPRREIDLGFDHMSARENPDMPTRRASNQSMPRGLGPSMPLLITMTCALAIAAGTAHGQSPDSGAGAGESAGEISFVEMIKQANKQYEQKVSEAIARGEFDQAREHVRELETVIPGSPQVAKLTAMIDEGLGATVLTERKVRGAIARGEFEAGKAACAQARGHHPELAATGRVTEGGRPGACDGNRRRAGGAGSDRSGPNLPSHNSTCRSWPV